MELDITTFLMHIDNVILSPFLAPLYKTIIILLIAYLLIRVGTKLILLFVDKVLIKHKRINKIKTITKIAIGIWDVVVGFVLLAIFLKYVLFVDISSMLSLAGIVSIAVAYASQTMIQDFMRGIILLLEESITIGDDVMINGIRGVIEDINLHCVYLRDQDQALHVIPNSQIAGYTNYTKPEE